MLDRWEAIGNNDLRYEDPDPTSGFAHIVLRDVDDGDTIVVNESDIRALRDRLTKTIEDYGL